MDEGADPSVFFWMDVDRSAGEKRKFFGLTVMIDVAVGDENSLDGIQVITNRFQPFLQCFEGDLRLYPRIDKGSWRIINKVDIHRLERKWDGKFNFINVIKHRMDHEYHPSPWVMNTKALNYPNTAHRHCEPEVRGSLVFVIPRLRRRFTPRKDACLILRES
jgi:hypothetical protein